MKELEDIIIDLNEYLEIVSMGLEHLDIGVRAIVDNIKVEVEELSKETEEIVLNMRQDHEQGRTVLRKC